MYGCLVTGPNGNTIFLPAAGYHWDFDLAFWDEVGVLRDGGKYGFYWSRTLTLMTRFAFDMLFYRSMAPDRICLRLSGDTVRAVRVP